MRILSCSDNDRSNGRTKAQTSRCRRMQVIETKRGRAPDRLCAVVSLLRRKSLLADFLNHHPNLKHFRSSRTFAFLLFDVVVALSDLDLQHSGTPRNLDSPMDLIKRRFSLSVHLRDHSWSDKKRGRSFASYSGFSGEDN